jgi:ADP-ribose pyrophosphatase
MKHQFKRQDVRVIEDICSYQGYFQLRTLKVSHRLFGGGWSAPLSRELFVRGDAVGVLPYDPAEDAVALIEQFRVGVVHQEHNPWLLELVAGAVEEGEDFQEVARREALEEAACSLAELEPVAGYYTSPGGSSEFLQLYCGRISVEGLGGIHGLDDEGEDIRVHVMSREQAWAELQAGTIINAPTVIGLQWLQLNWKRLQQQWC